MPYFAALPKVVRPLTMHTARELSLQYSMHDCFDKLQPAEVALPRSRSILILNCETIEDFRREMGVYTNDIECLAMCEPLGDTADCDEGWVAAFEQIVDEPFEAMHNLYDDSITEEETEAYCSKERARYRQFYVDQYYKGEMLQTELDSVRAVRCAKVRVLSTYAPRDCMWCGARNYGIGYSNAQKLVDNKTCFTCDYWLNRVEAYREGKLLVVDGCVYYDAGRIESPAHKTHMGYGGREWRIKLKKTGDIIETNNLWHNGDVPDIFRPQMPDNAEFLPTSDPLLTLTLPKELNYGY